MAFLSMFAFIISRRIPLSLASVLEFRHQSLTLKYIEIGLLHYTKAAQRARQHPRRMTLLNPLGGN